MKKITAAVFSICFLVCTNAYAAPSEDELTKLAKEGAALWQEMIEMYEAIKESKNPNRSRMDDMSYHASQVADTAHEISVVGNYMYLSSLVTEKANKAAANDFISVSLDGLKEDIKMQEKFTTKSMSRNDDSLIITYLQKTKDFYQRGLKLLEN